MYIESVAYGKVKILFYDDILGLWFMCSCFLWRLVGSDNLCE